MTTKTRGWPPARRKAQAQRIRAQKPWLHATGPRTEAGKARTARNAYRHGFRSADYRHLCALLRSQKNFIKQVRKHGYTPFSLKTENSLDQ